jgi:hypothetical protein
MRERESIGIQVNCVFDYHMSLDLGRSPSTHLALSLAYLQPFWPQFECFLLPLLLLLLLLLLLPKRGDHRRTREMGEVAAYKTFEAPHVICGQDRVLLYNLLQLLVI